MLDCEKGDLCQQSDLSLAEIRPNLNTLLESFIIVILWISVN